MHAGLSAKMAAAPRTQDSCGPHPPNPQEDACNTHVCGLQFLTPHAAQHNTSRIAVAPKLTHPPTKKRKEKPDKGVCRHLSKLHTCNEHPSPPGCQRPAVKGTPAQTFITDGIVQSSLQLHDSYVGMHAIWAMSRIHTYHARCTAASLQSLDNATKGSVLCDTRRPKGDLKAYCSHKGWCARS